MGMRDEAWGTPPTWCTLVALYYRHKGGRGEGNNYGFSKKSGVGARSVLGRTPKNKNIQVFIRIRCVSMGFVTVLPFDVFSDPWFRGAFKFQGTLRFFIIVWFPAVLSYSVITLGFQSLRFFHAVLPLTA